jgi:hypothetical protein
MIIVLFVVLILVAAVNLTRRDIAYTGVILWALAGIATNFQSLPVIFFPTWVTFVLVILSLGFAYLMRLRDKGITNA